MDALERLMVLAEQKYQDESAEETIDPLVRLSPKELRRRFDEYGSPREGFDTDGNIVSSENGDSSKSNSRVKAIRERASRRRTRWE